MKPIFLMTIPHSGTHTMHMLFGILGGIEVWWSHFQKAGQEEIDIILKCDRTNFVAVQTFRDKESLARAYKRRGDKVTVDAHWKFYEDNVGRFPVPIILPIEAPNELKTRIALQIFEKCEVDPPAKALEFMKTWEKINAFNTPLPKDLRLLIKTSLTTHRLLPNRRSEWPMK